MSAEIDETLGIVGRARLDSNQRHLASEAQRSPRFADESERGYHAVTTGASALRAVAAGEPTALSQCVRAIGELLRVVTATDADEAAS